MNASPLPLVGSGRRLPSAGPGRQPGQWSLSLRPGAGLLAICVALTLMLTPAVVAVLAMSFAGRLDQPSLPSITPPLLVAIVGPGRALLTLALAACVTQATDLE